MNYLGIEDEYLPTIPKPSLQQYDPYQIYDLYCRDILYIDNETGNDPPVVLMKDFVAAQHYSPSGIILCDFRQIALMYP